MMFNTTPMKHTGTDEDGLAVFKTEGTTPMTDAPQKFETAQELFEYLSKFTETERHAIHLEAHDVDGWHLRKRDSVLSDGSKTTDLVIADKPTAPAVRVFLEDHGQDFLRCTIREGVTEDAGAFGGWLEGKTVVNWQNLRPGDKLKFEDGSELRYPVQTVSFAD